jgi:hypothetical protein
MNKIIVFALAITSSSLTAWAQGQAVDGNIEGVVRSADGQPVGNAQIKARNQRTGLERQATTSLAGTYSITLLPSGVYTVTAEASGFSTTVRPNVEISAGQVVTVPFSLAVAPVATTVEVTEQIPAVETGRTVVSNTQEEILVRNLPTAGRSIQDFYTLQPGVNARPLSTGGSGTGTATTVYGGLGLRQINVDGVSNQLQGAARNIVISQEAIQEFQTVTNFSAEFGRVAGGLQNAFTRSGTNETHGSGFYFVRDRSLSATPKLLAPGAAKPDFLRQNFGGTIGGAIKKDRLFYFGTYERWFQNLPQVLTITPANAQALGIPLSNIGVSTSTFRAHTTTAKVDWVVNEKNRLFVRHNYYFDRESPLGSGLVSSETLSRWDEAPQNLTAQWVSTISTSLLNELRFLWADRGISNGIEADPNAPSIQVQGVATFNGNSNGNRVTNEHGIQIINNLTWIQGRHTIKAGLDILPVNFRERLTNINGEFVFGGLPAVAGVRGAVTALDQFLNTTRGAIDPATGRPFSYSRFTRSIGKEFYDATVVNHGYFVQDDIRLTDKLKLSLGLRYELFWRPEGLLNPDFPATGNIPQDTNNWAPRAGIAWDPKGDGKTVFRAGGGIFFNTIVAQTFNNFFRGNGVEVLNLNVTPTDPGAPAFTRSQVPPPAGVVRPITDLRVFAPQFDDLTVYNFFATVERQLARNLAVSATYQGTRGRQLPFSRIDNLTPTGQILADGRRRWTANPRPDRRFGNIFVAESGATQNYNGLILTANQRFSRGLSFQASYHYSRTYGFGFANDFTGFGIFTTPSDPQSRAFDGGRGDFDMRHRFLLLATWAPKFPVTGKAGLVANGWQLSTRTILQPGFPYNGTVGQDLNGDTVFNDRPVGIPYNNFTLPGYYALDLRLTRNFKIREQQNLEVIAETFNTLNRKNVTDVVRVWGPNPTPNANFGTPTAAENARQFQLALRYSF